MVRSRHDRITSHANNSIGRAASRRSNGARPQRRPHSTGRLAPVPPPREFTGRERAWRSSGSSRLGARPPPKPPRLPRLPRRRVHHSPTGGARLAARLGVRGRARTSSRPWWLSNQTRESRTKRVFHLKDFAPAHRDVGFQGRRLATKPDPHRHGDQGRRPSAPRPIGASTTACCQVSLARLFILGRALSFIDLRSRKHEPPA